MKSIFRIFAALSASLSLPMPMQAQPPDFARVGNVAVYHNGQRLENPWAGGLHLPQFGQTDLDDDGTKDLFVFDRSNNHVTTFLNSGIGDSVSYRHAPQFSGCFPYLHDWALLADFDGDGLEDLFTYLGAGRSGAYRATRNPDGSLQYSLFEDTLGFMGFAGFPINILINANDIPGICDVNGDGDLDLLAFDFSGKKVEYYECLSQEITGTPGDTLWYELRDQCWGDFVEANDNNDINLLDESCTGGGTIDQAQADTPAKSGLHAGSTLLAADLNGDDAKDLIIGDVAFNNLVMLTNTGTPDDAVMTEKDTNFPSYGTAANVQLFPASFYLDTDNDGLQDLLVAPNDKTASQATHNVWRYKNTGTANEATFDFQQDDFLISGMIDPGTRSYPAITDINADGLPDIVIGHRSRYNNASQAYVGALAAYANIGTDSVPAFELLTGNLFQLDSLNLNAMMPAFGDVDGDGDMDMLAGDASGFLHYFENTAETGQAMQLQARYLHWFQVPDALDATPCLYDLTGNGLPDLVCGERNGKLQYFENTSTVGDTITFAIQSNFWGEVDVRRPDIPNLIFGYSAPAIAQLNPDGGELHLLSASESGYVSVYTNLEAAAFSLQSNTYSDINEGGRGGIAAGDLNNDGFAELLVGNARGGLSLFSQGSIATSANQMVANISYNITLTARPNPGKGVFDISASGLPPQTAGKANIALYDLQGRQLQASIQAVSQGKWQVDLSGRPSGMYLCVLQTELSKQSCKLAVW